MANTTHIQLSRERLAIRRSQILWLIVGVPVTLYIMVVMGLIPAAIVGAVSFLLTTQLDAKRRSGMVGEEDALSMLDITLPSEYVVFNQVMVPNPGSQTGYTEIDLVVIGPTGIFTLEVKNNHGTIYGGPESADHWKVRKVGRRGKPYMTTMRNPVRQARSQVLALGDHLREYLGIKVWIYPMVILPSTGRQWRPRFDYSMPVTTATGAWRFIRSEQRGYLSDNHQQRIIEALSELCQNKSK